MPDKSPSIHPPVEPVPQLDAWSSQLKRVAQQPLEFCEDFPAVAQRWEAWWHQEVVDRPLLVAQVNKRPARPVTRRLDLLEQPDRWFEAKLEDVRQTRLIGDALPYIRADFGPVLLGGMLGGRLEFGSDTGWTHAFINDDWSNAPDWTLGEDNKWWRQLWKLSVRASSEADGRYLVCTPDLGGSADVLLNLRGSEGLCMDMLTRPETVRDAVDMIYPAWRKAFMSLYDIALSHGAGLIHWLGIWSDRPYVIPACDFNYLIGQDDFNRLFLPDIARQAATVRRAVFHLDGPGAARHIDALLEVPDIQAIQFTPGEGTPSALAWLEMFRKVQAKGRSLFIMCPSAEAVEVRKALKPEGLALLATDAKAESIDAVFEAYCP